MNNWKKCHISNIIITIISNIKCLLISLLIYLFALYLYVLWLIVHYMKASSWPLIIDILNNAHMYSMLIICYMKYCNGWDKGTAPSSDSCYLLTIVNTVEFRKSQFLKLITFKLYIFANEQSRTKNLDGIRREKEKLKKFLRKSHYLYSQQMEYAYCVHPVVFLFFLKNVVRKSIANAWKFFADNFSAL